MTKEEKIRLLDKAIDSLLDRQHDLERELKYERQNRAVDQRRIENLEAQVRSLNNQIIEKENEKTNTLNS